MNTTPPSFIYLSESDSPAMAEMAGKGYLKRFFGVDDVAKEPTW